MHKTLRHHALNQSLRVVTFALPSAPVSYRTRSNKSWADRPEETAQQTNDVHEHVTRQSSPRSPSRGGRFTQVITSSRVPSKHSSQTSSSRPSTEPAVQNAERTTPTQGQCDSSVSEADRKEEEDKLPLRPPPRYLRRVAQPKRFAPLLQEIQKIGQDYKTPKGGRQKSLDRSIVATEILDAELRWISRNYPHPKSIQNILKILVQDRKIKPSPSHYEALILGNCFPELGSVENVTAILREMEREGIPMEPPVYYAVLMVLAMHPDTYLRAMVQQRLAQQWIPTPATYTQLNIVTMIREDQLELATLELEKLQAKGTPVAQWVWVIYIHAICDRHDFEALAQLLYKLYDREFHFPRPTLLHVLAVASEGGDVVVTKWVWHSFVETMHIVPDEALCMNVLRLAANHKDISLADSVAVVLESVAGNTTTVPPSLADTAVGTKSDVSSLTIDFSEPPDPKSRPKPANGRSDVDVDFEMPLFESLAVAFSTPVPLPSPSSPPPPSRKLPTEAVSLLQKLRAEVGSPRKIGYRSPGNLYPLFREETGLRGARFDPRLALMEGRDGRKK